MSGKIFLKKSDGFIFIEGIISIFLMEIILLFFINFYNKNLENLNKLNIRNYLLKEVKGLALQFSRGYFEIDEHKEFDYEKEIILLKENIYLIKFKVNWKRNKNVFEENQVYYFKK